MIFADTCLLFGFYFPHHSQLLLIREPYLCLVHEHSQLRRTKNVVDGHPHSVDIYLGCYSPRNRNMLLSQRDCSYGWIVPTMSQYAIFHVLCNRTATGLHHRYMLGQWIVSQSLRYRYGRMWFCIRRNILEGVLQRSNMDESILL